MSEHQKLKTTREFFREHIKSGSFMAPWACYFYSRKGELLTILPIERFMVGNIYRFPVMKRGMEFYVEKDVMRAETNIVEFELVRVSDQKAYYLEIER